MRDASPPGAAEEAARPAEFRRRPPLGHRQDVLRCCPRTATTAGFPPKGADTAEGAGCPQAQAEVLAEARTRAAVAAATSGINDEISPGPQTGRIRRTGPRIGAHPPPAGLHTPGTVRQERRSAVPGPAAKARSLPGHTAM
ncbi:hypothetical protein [Streptomyces sp. NPDC002265]|uniref:hypothetical protein n=1 Tax=Streptomyces sp. NPDC002265 TaxID=3154415 RepID=UPI003327A2E1